MFLWNVRVRVPPPAFERSHFSCGFDFGAWLGSEGVVTAVERSKSCAAKAGFSRRISSDAVCLGRSFLVLFRQFEIEVAADFFCGREGQIALAGQEAVQD